MLNKFLNNFIILKKKEHNKKILLLSKKQNLINSNFIKNSIFYKDFSFSLLVVYENMSYNLNSSSFTIIKHPKIKNYYILNVRLINYYLEETGKAIRKENHTLSFNKIIILNNKFNIVNENLLDVTCRQSDYIGIEDVRLFNFNNKIYYIGSSYNTDNKKIQIVSNEYNLTSNVFNKKYIKPNFITSNEWEKNWVFFNNNNKLNVIYKWYPIQICEINYKTNMLNLIEEKHNVPHFFKKLRGSTNGVEFNNKIYFITHFHREILDKKNYLHTFVVFDKNMNLLGYSDPFNFENYLVEYCIGMELSCKNNFIITYSTLDKTTKLIVVTSNYIDSIIRNL